MMKKYFDSNNLIVYQNEIMQNNSIVIQESQNVYIVDPGFDIVEIFDKYKNFKNKIVILTHCHYDHCGDFKLINDFATKIYLSKNIKNEINNLDKNLFFSVPPELKKTIFVENNEIFNEFIFYLTPGHSIDSMCIKYKNYLLTGDHIFANSIGRTDFPTSNPKQMNESLIYIKKIIQSNKKIKIIPGHGEIIDGALLLETNPYI